MHFHAHDRQNIKQGFRVFKQWHTWLMSGVGKQTKRIGGLEGAESMFKKIEEADLFSVGTAFLSYRYR
jgi:hypothetical protein